MDFSKANRIVVKVGTSSLTYDNGKPNFRRIEQLTRILSDLHNSGKEVVLVTSGAITVGVDKLRLSERPSTTKEKQAVAAVGQCVLMSIYDKIFSEYNKTVAQILLTRDTVEQTTLKTNAKNTFNSLFDMGAIPIVNENDTVSTAELEGIRFGDNDTLSGVVACLVEADLLIMVTDIDGLYDKSPSESDAQLIPVVEEITEEIFSMAGGSGSKWGTGGMTTKITAAKIATNQNIPACIISGENLNNINRLLEGKQIGTLFTC